MAGTQAGRGRPWVRPLVRQDTPSTPDVRSERAGAEGRLWARCPAAELGVRGARRGSLRGAEPARPAAREAHAVTLLQTWLIIGVPFVVVAAALFIGRSRLRAWLGYGVLVGLVAVFLFVPTDGGQGGLISAAVVGSAAFVFVATGRGTHVDDEFVEHHQDRRKFTTAAPQEH
ncbi:hypothetical protein FTX61_01000 [Nitriliruptoraceae bacterium ZYF776]|nr:hypothetical protein [Profundirhabdus halotolerans]